nr:reverse transcriptase domain-containing protein [Tanacetum cinerariifolium]
KKKCIKDPIEIHNIKQRDGKSREDFMKRYKLEIRDGEVAASNHEWKKSFPSWKQQEGEDEGTEGPMIIEAEIGGHCVHHMYMDDGSASEILCEHCFIRIRPKIKNQLMPATTPLIGFNGEDEGTEGPMIIEAEIGGHCVHHMYIDDGSASEILYEHCFIRLRPKIKNQLMPATTPLIGFNGKIIWPIEQIQLLVKIKDEEHSTTAWINFVVVSSPSPYNGNIRRPGVRKLQAVPLTAHEMLKLPVEGGVITLKSSRLVPLECAMVSGPERNLSATKQIVEERVKVAINPEYLEQTVMIDSTLLEEGRNKLCDLLQRNLDIFSWKPADITGR